MNKICKNCNWSDWIHDNNEHAKRACATCNGGSNKESRLVYSMPRPLVEANYVQHREPQSS